MNTPSTAPSDKMPGVDKASVEDGAAKAASTEDQNPKKTFGFYAIVVSLALLSLLTSLESTVTSTALPTIIGDLGGGYLFIWVVNGFSLTKYVNPDAIYS